MTSESLIVVIAISEGLFVILIVGLLIANRMRQRVRARRARGAAELVAEPMRRWLVGVVSAGCRGRAPRS